MTTYLSHLIRRNVPPILAVALVAANLTAPAATQFNAGEFAGTRRVSVSEIGESAQEANGWSSTPKIAACARQYIAFTSNASNLIPNDSNGVADVFLRDTVNQTIELISVSSTGEQGNGPSGAAHPADPLRVGLAISADARYVAFSSSANNLVTDDTNLVIDVFVRDRLLGSTTRVSVSSDGQGGYGGGSGAYIYGIDMSEDGRFVVFDSWAYGLTEHPQPSTKIILRDRDTDEDGVFDEPGQVSTILLSESYN